ncbi:hypothetical protein [Xanthomonas euvesicatoria]|uniref:hypothetical protein n=1 Tax=Xanthomonas euvesicatoria TaxID=456327 RepID=UPI0032B5DE84
MIPENDLLKENLSIIILELAKQAEVGKSFSEKEMAYADQIAQMVEWVENAGEYGLAYENIVCLLESYSFILSGSAAVKLLEVGVIFGFKTELDKDERFDRRS